MQKAVAVSKHEKDNSRCANPNLSDGRRLSRYSITSQEERMITNSNLDQYLEDVTNNEGESEATYLANTIDQKNRRLPRSAA